MSEFIKYLIPNLATGDTKNKCIRMYNLPHVEMYNMSFEHFTKPLEITILVTVDYRADVTHVQLINTLPRLSVDETISLDNQLKHCREQIDPVVNMMVEIEKIKQS
jgi:hypothetical protein